MPDDEPVTRPDPYQVLHWGALAGQIGAFAWGIATLAGQPEGMWPRLLAAALTVAGCTYLLSWIAEQRLTATLPDQWGTPGGESPAQPARRTQPARPARDDDADWEVGD